MSETFKIKGINFDFRNKYKYEEETEGLKRVLIFLIPYIEDYLKNKEIIQGIKNKIEVADYYVHFAITDPKIEYSLTKYGSVSFDNKKKQLIIILRLINETSTLIKFELMKTMIHEIFHLFVEGEENVKNSTKYFMNSFDLETRKRVLKELLTPEEKKIIEESLK